MDFARLDLLAARLGAMRPLSRTELARLRREFMIENTYNSNAIEGNTLTLGNIWRPSDIGTHSNMSCVFRRRTAFLRNGRFGKSILWY